MLAIKAEICGLLCIDILLIFFQILVLREHWVLTESRIPLKAELGGGGGGGENCCTFHYFSQTDSIKPSLLFSYIVGSLYF